MFRTSPLAETPRNFDEFRQEIAEGLGALFGQNAAEQYRQHAEAQFQFSLQHPLVKAYEVSDGDRTAGLLIAVMTNDAARIPFYHVLGDYSATDAPFHLVLGAVDDLRRRGLRHIVAECVSLSPAAFGDAFLARDFKCIPRLLMSIDLQQTRTSHGQLPRKSHCIPENLCGTIGNLVDVYRNHPDRPLHIDLQDNPIATRFVEEVFSGSYGIVYPRYLRAMWENNCITGVILGCEISPDCGFVLHVAVPPHFQSKGIGTQLMHELLHEFRQAQLTRAALAVTEANPAVHLYRRIGFETLRRYDTYVWQSPERNIHTGMDTASVGVS